MHFLLTILSWALLAGTASAQSTPSIPRLKFPITKPASGVYYQFYDHDSSVNKLKNFYCKTDTTYDQHKGTDIRANRGTAIYASARGGVYYTINQCPNDGYLGSTCGSGFGNHVRMDHTNILNDGKGWTTIYAHMKLNTPVGKGTYNCGARLGEVASSGSSNANHLHFEPRLVQDSGSYASYDPFGGQCSAQSLWWYQNGSDAGDRCY